MRALPFSSQNNAMISLLPLGRVYLDQDLEIALGEMIQAIN